MGRVGHACRGVRRVIGAGWHAVAQCRPGGGRPAGRPGGHVGWQWGCCAECGGSAGHAGGLRWCVLRIGGVSMDARKSSTGPAVCDRLFAARSSRRGACGVDGVADFAVHRVRPLQSGCGRACGAAGGRRDLLRGAAWNAGVSKFPLGALKKLLLQRTGVALCTQLQHMCSYLTDTGDCAWSV